MKKDLLKRHGNETAEYYVVTGKTYFTIVSNESEDKRRLRINYGDFYYWPQFSMEGFVEAEILSRIQDAFPENKGKSISISYNSEYVTRIQQIAIFNRLEYS